jgi:ketosteroid isomerase-like protein
MRPVSLYLILSALFLLAITHPFAPTTIAMPESDAVAADHSLITAIAKLDQATAAKLLDPEFTWTDRTGKTRSNSDILSALAGFNADKDADTKVIDAGQIVLIHGDHRIPAQNAAVRFLRIWIKRPQGWQLLVYQETTKAQKNPEKRSGFGAPSNGMPVACENPCKTIPYKPDAAAEQEVVSMWQAVERYVLTNDVNAWIPNFTDDFIFVTPDGGAPLNKADRIAMLTELRRTNTTLVPAEVSSMKVWVFGNAAVMRSEHKPMHGKALHVTRLFEKHNGHWQITFGQQTWIE